MSPLPVMRNLVVPTAVSGIHFVDDVAFMCYSAAGTVGAATVLVLPDIHCSLAVGDSIADVVGLVATIDASDARASIVAVDLVACAVAGGVAMWVLSDAVISMPLVCPVQTCPSPSIFS